MTKEQIFAFLKAPFSKSFITSYFFSFFGLLSVPFLSRLVGLLFKNLEKIEHLSKEELSPFLADLLQKNIFWGEVLSAGLGIVLAYVFLSSYALLLTHKTAISKRGLFNAERFVLPFSEIVCTVPKFVCFVLLCSLASIIFVGGLVLFSTLVVALGTMVSKARLVSRFRK